VGDFTALSLTPLSQLDLDSLDLVEVLFVLQDINPTFEPPELSTEELATVTLGELHAQMLASLHRQSGE
jgi:hypothetical protein